MDLETFVKRGAAAQKAVNKVIASVVVTAQCTHCKAKRDFGPGEVPKDEMPTCELCGCVMVAVAAKGTTRA